MLVLSRRISEEILIGNNIIVRIERVDGGRVKVGIEAPKDMEVDRGEVRARKIAEGRKRELTRAA